MTWNVLTDLDTGQYMTATHADQLRENIQHLGSLLSGDTPLSDLAYGAVMPVVAVGTYSGNDAATKAITGLGYQPRVLIIFAQASTRTLAIKTSSDTTYAYVDHIANQYYVQDMIVSLDADGFTVGDGTGIGNALTNSSYVYTYIAFG